MFKFRRSFQSSWNSHVLHPGTSLAKVWACNQPWTLDYLKLSRWKSINKYTPCSYYSQQWTDGLVNMHIVSGPYGLAGEEYWILLIVYFILTLRQCTSLELNDTYRVTNRNNIYLLHIPCLRAATANVSICEYALYPGHSGEQVRKLNIVWAKA